MSKKYFVKYGFTNSVSTPHMPCYVIIDLTTEELDIETIKNKLKAFHFVEAPYSKYITITDLIPLT